MLITTKMMKFRKKFPRIRIGVPNIPAFRFSEKSETVVLKDYITKKDHMISGFFKDGSARFVMSDISQTLKDAESKFNISNKEKLEQLGIAYNTALIMNSFLNGEERVKLISQYFKMISEEESQMTTIYSESIGTGEVRGFIEEGFFPNSDLDKEKSSFLKISKILYNRQTEVYGIIKLINSNQLTEDDIFKYFEESEQIRTHVFFHHELNEKNFISQGFILQKMPDCDLVELEKRFFHIINNRNFRDINKNGLLVSGFMKVFNDLGIEVEGIRRTPIQFYCRCSKSQFINVLTNLGKPEIEDMRRRDQRIITCKNCNTNYNLSDEDFDRLLK
jgi:molecular chaperone Hsp33